MSILIREYQDRDLEIGHIDMFLDLTGENHEEQKDGITIHGHAFRC